MSTNNFLQELTPIDSAEMNLECLPSAVFEVKPLGDKRAEYLSKKLNKRGRTTVKYMMAIALECVVGWSSLKEKEVDQITVNETSTVPTDKEIPYSKENLQLLLNVSRDFRNEMWMAIEKDDSFNQAVNSAKDLRKQEKNSEGSAAKSSD